MATSAPFWANFKAVAHPMPADAPVTNATLPPRIMVCCSRVGPWSFEGIVLGTLTPDESVAASTDLPPWLWPRAAYVHVPFCAHHCNYCDFAIAVGQDQQIELYLDALAAELAMLGTPQPVRTLFVGGGTPTHLAAGQLERLLALLRRWFVLEEGGEFSIEANPGTLGTPRLQSWRTMASTGSVSAPSPSSPSCSCAWSATIRPATCHTLSNASDSVSPRCRST